MKCQRVLPACYLLLWTLAGSKAADKITVKTVSGGVRLTCEGTDAYFKKGEELVKSQELPYKDGASGEYTCVHNHSKSEEYIFVKFRTCDNCIEIDPASILGLAVGNVLATIVLGVAVYLVASQSGPVASHKKSSDRQHLVPNEGSGRGPNDHYQRLRFNKGGPKDTYDFISNNR
ncbi:T-cell surface glycoprotein CD3 gamma chain-like [Scophthalmus maximus]|uniref:T-cell surface glycoprotein CD3 gamma chain n=1 Tax=Scophthalmus maximus TaxID=52904 RepID=A0A8D2ZEG8_SCOMX|nr:T-cell surface glycoprotein CD3 gamma chain-like [Scophthalmus maximus]XP_035479179.1 T-cell surface glycoprotein CD3 gamma chain-like [Scophthalmus maximus]